MPSPASQTTTAQPIEAASARRLPGRSTSHPPMPTSTVAGSHHSNG
jgi:hypothetical protein